MCWLGGGNLAKEKTHTPPGHHVPTVKKARNKHLCEVKGT
jgi:hypothetical protein